jgi:hypothetical protein
MRYKHANWNRMHRYTEGLVGLAAARAVSHVTSAQAMDSDISPEEALSTA